MSSLMDKAMVDIDLIWVISKVKDLENPAGEPADPVIVLANQIHLIEVERRHPRQPSLQSTDQIRSLSSSHKRSKLCHLLLRLGSSHGRDYTPFNMFQ
jgi:hypothetical protein